MDNIDINIDMENIQTKTNYTYKSIDDFRAKATEEDYKKLEEYILSKKNKQDSFPNEFYDFSYSAAAKELRERGYLPLKIKRKSMKDNDIMDTKEEHNQIPHKTLTITGGKNRTYKTRSYPFDEDVLKRFDAMAAYYEDCSKKALLSEILSQGLKDFGF